MFTGIITDIGSVQRVDRSGGDTRLVFHTHYNTDSLTVGTSISCCGCCLTIIQSGKHWFAVNVSEETLNKTTIRVWNPGTLVNFEQALCVGGTLGGHIVLGHVDGVARVADLQFVGDSQRLTLIPPTGFMRYLAEKGSVALDGVALTVNEVGSDHFCVNVIPHTQAVTTFSLLKRDHRVNMEIDIFARYIARLLGKD